MEVADLLQDLKEKEVPSGQVSNTNLRKILAKQVLLSHRSGNHREGAALQQQLLPLRLLRLPLPIPETMERMQVLSIEVREEEVLAAERKA